MIRWKRWLAPRGQPRGLSTGVGAVGGLILFTTALTGGIAATQIVRVHAALAQAAQAAAQSEQQSGCWTQGTTSTVYHTLKGAGVNAGSVALTADTPNSTTYGGSVTAGLTTKVPVSVLGAKLMQIPVSAAANATSFYTPTTAGASNTSCITPATCPTKVVNKTVPGHYTTETVYVNECTPTSQKVCGPVTTRQCGYHSQQEYTCTPVQSCGDVSRWSSTANCTYYDGNLVSCTPGYVTVYQCSTTNSCGWNSVSVYSCSNVTTTQCSTHTSQSCKEVPTSKQVWVPQYTVPTTVSACG